MTTASAHILLVQVAQQVHLPILLTHKFPIKHLNGNMFVCTPGIWHPITVKPQADESVGVQIVLGTNLRLHVH